MSAQTIILAVIAATFIALAVYIAVTLKEFRHTLASIEQLANRLDTQVVPLASKANRALDEINEELARVEGIVRNVEDVSFKVGATAEVARHALSSPLVKLASWSAGMKKAVSTFAHPEGEQDEGHDEIKEGSA
jgi:uncharacterized protein YoxC